jgi:hypothetical protein
MRTPLQPSRSGVSGLSIRYLVAGGGVVFDVSVVFAGGVVFDVSVVFAGGVVFDVSVFAGGVVFVVSVFAGGVSASTGVASMVRASAALSMVFM